MKLGAEVSVKTNVDYTSGFANGSVIDANILKTLTVGCSQSKFWVLFKSIVGVIPYSLVIIKSSLIVGLMHCTILYRFRTSSQSSCFSFLGTRQLEHGCPLLQGTITQQFTDSFHVTIIFLNLVGFLNYHLGGSQNCYFFPANQKTHWKN